MTHYLASEDFQHFDKRKRTALINSISGIRTAYIALSQNEQGAHNACTLTNVTHVGAHPAQMSVLFRPDNGKRHTLSNYRETKKLTLVCMPFDHAEVVHESSVNAPEGMFELDIIGAETIAVEGRDILLPKHFMYAIELEYIEEFTLSNGCVYTVGTILGIHFGKGLQMLEDGQLTYSKPPTLAIGLQQYASLSSEGLLFPYPSADKYGL